MGRLLDEDVVVKEIKEWQKAFRANCHCESASDVNLILNAIKNLPPAEKTAHWIGNEGSYICSRCGNDPLDYISTMGAVNDAYMEILMDFCPCCGAHMIEKKVTE